MSQDLTYLTEKEAYTIALRMPSDIDRFTRWDFEECVQWFQYNKAEHSNPAHFIKMFRQKSKQNCERRNRDAKEKLLSYGTKNDSKFVFYNFLEENK